MKKFLSILLVAVMVLGLCACGNGDSQQSNVPQQTTAPQETEPKLEGFHVGYGRERLDGGVGTPLAGYGDGLSRLSEGVLNYLYATCIAMTDETGKTVLLYTADTICTNTDWTDDMRAAITEATGVPADCIQLTATHTHSGPDIRDSLNQESAYYKNTYLPAFVNAGKQAMEDRSPATVFSGDTYVDRLNFVRHYVMSDGNIAGDNFGDTEKTTAVSNHHEADNQVQIIRFVRQDKSGSHLVHRDAGGQTVYDGTDGLAVAFTEQSDGNAVSKGIFHACHAPSKIAFISSKVTCLT